MSENSYPPMRQALQTPQPVSENEEDRYRAIARERAMHSWMTLQRLAREEGWKEAHVELALTRQLTRRFGPLPEWVAPLLQDAPAKQLDTWLDRILDAPTLEAVFADP
jgi:hypothetical protein